jgi:hypothetical protein
LLHAPDNLAAYADRLIGGLEELASGPGGDTAPGRGVVLKVGG